MDLNTLPGISRLLQHKVLLCLFVLTGMMGCGENDQNVHVSLPTGGELVIGVDESLRPFSDAEIAMFSSYYPDARITPLYLPEKQVIEKLLNNEIQTGIICRDLYPEECDFITNMFGHSARTFKLAEDKIVAVVNGENPVDTISFGNMEKILSGATTDWGQLGPSFEENPPIIVVLTGSSSVDRFLSSFSGPLSPVSTYSLDMTVEVIDYVKKNVSALGIVGGSWFFQKGNKYRDLKLLAWAEDFSEAGNSERRLSREVFAVTHEPLTGLGSGFISFMASRKGQLIVSKAGMTPYKPIEREIEVSESFKNWQNN